jgi:hypothetical protein
MKNRCPAAVKINTKGETFKKIQPINGSFKKINPNLNSNIEEKVCLLEEEENNINKINAYVQCSKTVKNGDKYCHIHLRMSKLNEKNIKEFIKDIVPQDHNDKRRWLDNVNHSFFDNMGKRGAKKKHSRNTFTFLDENDPILAILNHKDPKKVFLLNEYAKNLFNGFIDEKNIDNKQIYNKKKENIDDLIKKIQNDDYETVSSVDDNDNKSIESDNDDDYDRIYSNENEEFYIDKKNLDVYKPDNNNDSTIDGTTVVNIGFLKETTEKYHIIKYDNKFYCIVKEQNIKKRGNVYLSIYNNLIFDKDMNYIGDLKKISENEYKYNFCDEI